MKPVSFKVGVGFHETAVLVPARMNVTKTMTTSHPQSRVPHLRDSFIVAKVGIREANRIFRTAANESHDPI